MLGVNHCSVKIFARPFGAFCHDVLTMCLDVSCHLDRIHFAEIRSTAETDLRIFKTFLYCTVSFVQ